MLPGGVARQSDIDGFEASHKIPQARRLYPVGKGTHRRTKVAKLHVPVHQHPPATSACPCSAWAAAGRGIYGTVCGRGIVRCERALRHAPLESMYQLRSRYEAAKEPRMVEHRSKLRVANQRRRCRSVGLRGAPRAELVKHCARSESVFKGAKQLHSAERACRGNALRRTRKKRGRGPRGREAICKVLHLPGRNDAVQVCHAPGVGALVQVGDYVHLL